MAEELRRYRSVAFDSARWEGFRYRDGDIVISTPAKCGTTWVQMLCALLIFQDPVLPSRLSELSPWLDIQTRPLPEVLAALEAQHHRRFIKTHTPLDGLPFDERVTYVSVGRDPRDVALSADTHWSNMNIEVIIGARAQAVGLDDLVELMPDGPPERPTDPDDRFEAWVEADMSEGFSNLALVVHHLATFWDRRALDNVALFHYADLQADLVGEMTRLARVLHIEIDDERVSALATAASFDSMRSRADELAPESDMAGFWHSTAGFFAKGGGGYWRSVVSSERLARYEARLRALATPDLAEWVTRGWRGRASGPDPSARPGTLSR